MCYRRGAAKGQLVGHFERERREEPWAELW